MKKSRAAALKALELDASLPEGHSALGLVRLYSDWDWTGATQSFKRAIEINPSLADARRAYASELAFLGRLPEAIDELEKVREIDPVGFREWDPGLGLLYEMTGHHDKAMAEWKRKLELAPSSHGPHKEIGRGYCQRGEFDKGIAALVRAVELSPDDPMIVGDLGHCYAVAGKGDDARKLLRGLELLSSEEYVDPLGIARIYVGLGQNEEALEALETAYELHAHDLPAIGWDRRFEPLYGEPRFQDLLRGIGLDARKTVVLIQ
ncbi:MAG: tetratricopeptide repeat protein [Candidatus Krumholzibacteriia bacterium]